MTTAEQPVPTTPSSLRLVMTLAIAGLISGIAIIGIYETTLPTITANKARELQAAVFKVLPGVSQMQQVVYRDGQLIVAVDKDADEQAIYGGYDEQGRFIGWAIPGAGAGFQDTIGLLYGYSPRDRQVRGMEILESRETPGLGDKIYKDMAFVGNFAQLSIDPEIVVVKKNTRSQPNEVDAITGATISSKAVVRIINETHTAWSDRLPASGAEPPLAPTVQSGNEDGS